MLGQLDKMYSEWVSISVSLKAEEKRFSVLHKLPDSAGRDVVVAVVKPLAHHLGISTSNCEPSNLKTEKEVQWCMEVVCYGLGLPISEHEAIRDCVFIYCEWLYSLTKPKICVPKPVCDDPNLYARKMIQHLYNLFQFRPNSNADIISRQCVLCHRVLRTLETLAHESEVLERETWDAILLFLLAINDTILSRPSVQDDICSKLGERTLSVLFKVWLLASHRCFPSPPLWKTFRELCCSWRHREVLVDQWNRANVALTSRLLHFMYGQQLPEVKIGDTDLNLVPAEMSNENVAQTWFRFLHTLGNPINLSHPEIISQTDRFYDFALSSESVIDPCQHPCLSSLPQIFYKAMRGVASLVDSFLGIAQIEAVVQTTGKSLNAQSTQQSVTPPHHRKTVIPRATSIPGKNLPKASLIAGLTSRSPSIPPSNAPPPPPQSPVNATPTIPSQHQRPQLSPSRPKCNSILHLFGEWLFEASLIGSGICTRSNNESEISSRRPSSLILDNKNSSGQAIPDSIEIPPYLTVENFETGQAEAVGALCRVFCAKRSGEEILPIYLARFYLCLQYGLSCGKHSMGQVISSILMNSCDILRQDLDGSMVLLPHFLSALELVLPDKEMKLNPLPNVSKVDLRRSAIQILLSALPLPLHFHDLTIKDLSGSFEKPAIKFQNLRSRLMNLLINALQFETDSTNNQMLLGGLLMCVQDSAAVEEFTQQTSPEPPQQVESVATLLSSDSAYALFVRAIYLICHRLISTWKTDLNVSLAALEVLSGLARIHLPKQDPAECKRAIKWICDFIVYQCSRPPPSHSKDLHSSIVAAYQCVTTWLLEHPNLLQEKDTVHTVLEVIELGISGSKSQGKGNEPIKFKAEKELKPASMRVKDAAETVLMTMIDHVGYFPPVSGPETLSALLDEESLLQHCNSWNGTPTPREEAMGLFRYFAVDNSFILALLEQHLGNDQDPQPTVTALIRGPFGKHAWAMQLRQLPRYKMGSNKPGTTVIERPEPMKLPRTPFSVKHRYFPDTIQKIPQCQADYSIPSMEAVIEDQVASSHEKMKKLIEKQMVFEEAKLKSFPIPDGSTSEVECKQPEICHEFQTARLFLSHLEFMNLESLKETLTQPVPSLVALDSSQPGFASQIEFLDALSNRTFDTVFFFYVRNGQKDSSEILSNVISSQNVHPHFLEFLLSLGWPVEVAKHAGWTGHVSTSWKVQTAAPKNPNIPPVPDRQFINHGGCLYNGQRQVLYWSDATSELAFVVPSKREKQGQPKCEEAPERIIDQEENTKSRVRFECIDNQSDSVTSPNLSAPKPRTLSLNLEGSSTNDGLVSGQGRFSGRKFGRSQSSTHDAKIMVVWLESYEDHLTFPLSALLQETATGLETTLFPRANEKDCFVIFIHSLKSGLFRIKMQGPVGRMCLALPLVDGMVTSRRILSLLIRQTALNLCRRRRLDADSSLPPHIKRRHKIQEIVEHYHLKMSEADFFARLFSSTTSQ